VPVSLATHRTPDYEITLSGTVVVCEVMQIDPDAADLADLDGVDNDDQIAGRWMPDRSVGC
jgi:hypothetical protein